MILLPIATAVVSYALVYWVDRRKRPALVGGAVGGLLGALALLVI